MLTSFYRRPIFQHAWVVSDLDAACVRWIDAFGAGPFFTARHHKAEGDYCYRGATREGDLSYAFGYCGAVQIQLVELHDDVPSIFQEMFPRGYEGFHHIGILGHDFPRDKAHLIDQGFDVATEMWSGADVCYFDARPQFGCFVEIHGTSPEVLALFDGWKQAHDSWDGQSHPIRDTAVLPKQDVIIVG